MLDVGRVKNYAPKSAIKIDDQAAYMNAVIDINHCIDCKICENVCQVNYPLEKKKQVAWFQGLSNNEDVRKKSSSGGIAAELSRTIIRKGGVVCSCKFENGDFIFRCAETEIELNGFAGFKYVKSNSDGVYKEILKYLNSDRTVLFIGLPCQCAGVKKLTIQCRKGKLYTVDLICHGTPSLKTLNTFMQQYHCNLEHIQHISFRDKGKFSLKKDGTSIVMPGTMDCYSIAFLNGLIYTENCYECYYADSKRVTDLTIGDSWGTKLSDAGKGVSLILCNTVLGKELLEKSDVYITDVDIENAIASNPQLMHLTYIPQNRDIFFNGYEKNRKFNMLIVRCCTVKWFKQFIKRQLIKLKILKV